jgi:hypothetical protein
MSQGKCPNCGSANIKRVPDFMRKQELLATGQTPTHYCEDCRIALLDPNESFSVPVTPDEIMQYLGGQDLADYLETDDEE